MTDTSDNIVLSASIDNPLFQERCRLRFVNAAISVTAEVVQTTAAGPMAPGSKSLPVTSVVGITQLMTVSDAFGNIIPIGTVVTGVSGSAGGTVTLNGSVTGSVGVAAGDVINFIPASHAQRLAFAGSLFADNVDLKMLAMAVLANTTNRTNCLANPGQAGGNIADSDIDFQVNSVFTGIATSRSWS